MNFALDFSADTKYFEFMAKKKKKMGRPPLKAKDKRTALVSLRLKETERDEFEKEAKARGLSISNYLLECWQKSRVRK